MIDWKAVRMLITDVDGVLTDGSLYYDANGESIKRFNVRDGLGIKRLMAAGVKCAVITGRTSQIVEARLRELEYDAVLQGVIDKADGLTRVRKLLPGISAHEIAYIGDDVNDLPILALVGIPIAVADAADEVLRIARHVTAHIGGNGAVREVCDLILAAKSGSV